MVQQVTDNAEQHVARQLYQRTRVARVRIQAPTALLRRLLGAGHGVEVTKTLRDVFDAQAQVGCLRGARPRMSGKGTLTSGAGGRTRARNSSASDLCRASSSIVRVSRSHPAGDGA